LTNLQNSANAQNAKITILNRLAEYAYARNYSNLRRNQFEFENVLKELSHEALTTERRDYIEKVCLFEIEEAIDRISIAKAYNYLSLLQRAKQEKAELYRAIRNNSYALDMFYKPEYALNLANIVIKDYEDKIFAAHTGLKEKDLLRYFSGYTKDEMLFLNKVIGLKIPELSTRALYRLSIIYTLGHASSRESEINTNLKQAVLMLNKAIALSGIKGTKIVNIVLVMDEQYAAHASTTIASALLNSDLDSFYQFHIVMDPDNAVSLESQQKLSAMQDIRHYKINFITVDHNLIPIELIKNRFQNCEWPLLISYRPFLSTILPNLDSVLSLDGDILVLRDLNYFNTIDMRDYFIAGVYDIGNPLAHNRNDRQGCYHLLPYLYINSGVMWFNLENMRNNNAVDLLINALKNTTCALKYFEQDLITVTFHDRINHISRKWNCAPAHQDTTNYYTQFILHYIEKNAKPWLTPKEEAKDFYKEYWLYRELTPWKTSSS
jgi:lipopolysaccharide biosynthesis glycosyltransferase